MTGDAHSSAIQVSPNGNAQTASIKITYELKGVTFSKTLQVNVLQPVFPETILIDSGVVLLDLFPNSDNQSFVFTRSNESFSMQTSGSDAILISLNPAVTGITEDPFASGNQFFQNNQQLGYNYPNLSPLLSGQDENAPLPEFTPTVNSDQPPTNVENGTEANGSSFIMGNTPVTLNPDFTFSRSIRVALKSNPNVSLGSISVSLVH